MESIVGRGIKGFMIFAMEYSDKGKLMRSDGKSATTFSEANELVRQGLEDGAMWCNVLVMFQDGSCYQIKMQ
jgi:hypothetical protein